MSDIVDLNVFVGPPRKVKIGERVYLLPRDIPAELYLEVIDLQNRPDDDLDDHTVVRKLRGDVLEMFQVHQPDMDKLPAAVTIPVLMRMIGHIYSGASDAPPPKPRASGSRGTRKPKAKAKPRPRSSRS